MTPCDSHVTQCYLPVGSKSMQMQLAGCALMVCRWVIFGWLRMEMHPSPLVMYSWELEQLKLISFTCSRGQRSEVKVHTAGGCNQSLFLAGSYQVGGQSQLFTPGITSVCTHSWVSVL